VTSSSLLFTARNARVDATTNAAEEESPEPGGTVPETSKSTGSGYLSTEAQETAGEKNLERTPYAGIALRARICWIRYYGTHVVPGFDVALPV